MLSRPHLVVVGAGAAATAALAELHRLRFDGRVTVVGSEHDRPYNRTAVNKGLLTGDATTDSLALPLTQPDGTTWLRGARATTVDLAACTVEVEGHRPVPYDGLLLASGSRPRPVPESWRPHVSQLVTLPDGRSLRQTIAAAARRVVVIGAGLVGTETAGLLTAAGHRVTLVDGRSLPLERHLGAAVAGWVVDRHAAAGTRSRFGHRVVDVRTGRRSAADVELDDGSVEAADVVVDATGAVPAVDWLPGARLDLTDGVRTDAELRPLSATRGRRGTRVSALPAVAAAGDLARWPHPVFGGTPMRVPHWGNALVQGAHAARTVLRELGRASSGDGPVLFAELPAFSTYVHSTKLHVIGVPHLGTRAHFVRGDPSAARFAVAFVDDGGTVVGAVAVGGAKAITALRPVIARGGSLDDARVPA